MQELVGSLPSASRMHRFLVGENAEWVDDGLRELYELLHPGGSLDDGHAPPREGYIYLVMGLLESSNAAVRRWAVRTMAMLIIHAYTEVSSDTIMLCVDALTARLQDDDEECLALQALHRVGESWPEVLSQCTHAVKCVGLH